MQVLFLAFGAARKRAVAAESAAVVAAGGRAVVLVSDKKRWVNETLAASVELVTPAELEARHLPRRIERAVLYQGPRRVARSLGRGPLGVKAKKALKTYEKSLAGRLHRRVFVPAHRRVWPSAGDRMIQRCFGPQGGPDLVVVADAQSIRRAVELMESWDSVGRGTPRVAYSVDSVVPLSTDAPQQPSAVR